jgi:hypothetical protein
VAVNIHDLIARTATAENGLCAARFVAPCRRGGVVRARVGGLVQTFRPVPADFEGWGVFAPSADSRTARLAEEADLPLVARYLALFPLLRVRLAAPASGSSSWLAYPVSEGDMAARFGDPARPVVVHLVTDGRAFEVVTARHAGEGVAFWFEDVDRRADPAPADRLRDARRALVEPADLRFPGLTPEMRTAYALAIADSPEFAARRREREREQAREARRQFRRDVEAEYGHWDDHLPGTHDREAVGAVPLTGRGEEERLRRALAQGGGRLRDAADRGAYYLVEWETADGARHTSAIAKGDLTVVSSGICLSGRDHDFDLQSLVGVVERRDLDW